MKIERHAKIIELINEYAIETQEELASRLMTRASGSPRLRCPEIFGS